MAMSGSSHSVQLSVRCVASSKHNAIVMGSAYGITMLTGLAQTQSLADPKEWGARIFIFSSY